MLYSLCLPPTNLTCNLLLLETLLYLPPFIMFSSSFCVQKLSTICTVTLCECVILCNNESLALLSNNNPQLLKVFHFFNVAKWQTVLASKFYFNIPTNTDVPYYVFFSGQVFNEQRHSCQGQVSFEDIRGASNLWWSAFQKFYSGAFAAAATDKGQARDHSRNIFFIFTQVFSLTVFSNKIPLF